MLHNTLNIIMSHKTHHNLQDGQSSLTSVKTLLDDNPYQFSELMPFRFNNEANILDSGFDNIRTSDALQMLEISNITPLIEKARSLADSEEVYKLLRSITEDRDAQSHESEYLRGSRKYQEKIKDVVNIDLRHMLGVFYDKTSHLMLQQQEKKFVDKEGKLTTMKHEDIDHDSKTTFYHLQSLASLIEHILNIYNLDIDRYSHSITSSLKIHAHYFHYMITSLSAHSERIKMLVYRADRPAIKKRLQEKQYIHLASNSAVAMMCRSEVVELNKRVSVNILFAPRITEISNYVSVIRNVSELSLVWQNLIFGTLVVFSDNKIPEEKNMQRTFFLKITHALKFHFAFSHSGESLKVFLWISEYNKCGANSKEVFSYKSLMKLHSGNIDKQNLSETMDIITQFEKDFKNAILTARGMITACTMLINYFPLYDGAANMLNIGNFPHFYKPFLKDKVNLGDWIAGEVSTLYTLMTFFLKDIEKGILLKTTQYINYLDIFIMETNSHISKINTDIYSQKYKNKSEILSELHYFNNMKLCATEVKNKIVILDKYLSHLASSTYHWSLLLYYSLEESISRE